LSGFFAVSIPRVPIPSRDFPTSVGRPALDYVTLADEQWPAAADNGTVEPTLRPRFAK